MGYRRTRPRLFHSGGFTLIEIIVVVAIMIILVSLAGSSMKGMMETLRMKEAIATTRGVMERARQMAVTLNRDVTLRIYQSSGDFGALGWRGFEYGVEEPVMDPNAPNYRDPTSPNFRASFVPAAPAERLPTGLVFHPSATFSVLLDASLSELQSGQDTGPDGKPRSYTSIRFTPEGRCELPTGRSWTLAIVAENTVAQSASLPRNYAVLQLDPTTAHVRVYRP